MVKFSRKHSRFSEGARPPLASLWLRLCSQTLKQTADDRRYITVTQYDALLI